MNQIAYPPVIEAMQQLKALSADEETRYRAERRALALIAERTEINAAERRGVAVGVALGKEESLQCMIKSGMDEAQARAILGI